MAEDAFQRFDAEVAKQVAEFAERVGVVVDPATVTSLQVAGQQLVEDMALEMAETAFDGIGVTLLQIYKTGNYPGGLQSKYMDEVAQILVAARPKEQEPWLRQWPLEPLRKKQRQMGDYEQGWNDAVTAAGARLDAIASGEIGPSDFPATQGDPPPDSPEDLKAHPWKDHEP